MKHESVSDPYRDYRTYEAHGVRVELSPGNGRRWFFRFPPSKVWFDAKNKFYALLHAAWKCGRSGEAMNWKPVRDDEA